MLPARIVTAPLTSATALSSWLLDAPTLIVVAALGLGYWRCARGSAVPPARRMSFFAGLALWALTAVSFLGVDADTLFWVRALQFVLLLLVVPFLLALAMPFTALRSALGEAGQARFDQALASGAARLLTHPLCAAASILALPWLVYTTAWYPALLEHAAVDQATRLLVVATGFGYFDSRLQNDPTPKKYPQLITLLLTAAEVIGDGVLGLVLWLGPVLAPAHYAARAWGPSMRLDQVVGAGIIWILGDVVGVPFLFAVLQSLRGEERQVEKQTDTDLDSLETTEPRAASGLWWENDPQLRDRFRR